MDWNGNGKFDPVDIGISIAAGQKDEPAPTEEPSGTPAGSEHTGNASSGCLGEALMMLFIAGIILI